jgi:hypothetical protein
LKKNTFLMRAKKLLFPTIVALSVVLLAFLSVFIFTTPPALSIFGVLLGASGTMLALTATTQASHSSALDSWLQFYGRIVHLGLKGPKRFTIKTYEQGMETIREKSEITRNIRSACQLILCSLISSALAMCISLTSENGFQNITLKVLWGVNIATMVWSGVLLASVAYKSIKTDLRRCEWTIEDLLLIKEGAENPTRALNSLLGLSPCKLVGALHFIVRGSL